MHRYVGLGLPRLPLDLYPLYVLRSVVFAFVYGVGLSVSQSDV